MILLDTSVWIEHLRDGVDAVRDLLERGEVLGHPWVVGELALGNLRNRGEVLALLAQLPQAAVATVPETARLIDAEALRGRGIGYVDAQLLAATRLTPDARLWTHDKRLAAVAVELGCAATGPASGGGSGSGSRPRS